MTPAEGRYCLAICWCGECDHHRPIPRERLDPVVWDKPAEPEAEEPT